MNSVKVGQIIILAGGTIAFCLWLRGRLVHSQPASSVRRMRGVRLRQVYPSPENETKTDVDIIAIHGLDTNSPDTWIWKHKEPRVNWWTWRRKETLVNWLEDQDMLPKRFPTARIFTCDWPADLLEQPDLIQKTIKEFARVLLAGIKSRTLATDDHGRKEDQPIVFVASCLGGIILAKALVIASYGDDHDDDHDDRYLSIRKATRGIVFLATPFRATSFRNVADWAEHGLRVWASIQNKQVSNLIEYIKSPFDPEDLVRDFTRLCQDKDHPCQVCNFYETGKSSLPRKIAPWLPAFLSQEQPVSIMKHLPIPLFPLWAEDC
jgi:hypothetical protein